jgi:hypothetical protein
LATAPLAPIRALRMHGAERQPVIVMPSVSIDSSGETASGEGVAPYEQGLFIQDEGLENGAQLDEAAVPSVPVSAVSTGGTAAKADASTAASPPPLPVDMRHAQGEQSINVDAMPGPPVESDGGLVDVDRADEDASRMVLSQPHEERRETAHVAAGPEAAVQLTLPSRGSSGNFMQRRACRPQSAPSAGTHRPPPTAGKKSH